MKELFFKGEYLEKALRAARLLHAITKKPVYVDEDFGDDEDEENPWGFFVSLESPMHEGTLYTTIGA